jgi:hypothetical protein
MDAHLAPLLAIANVDLARPFGADVFLGEMGADHERRASASLAFGAVAGANNGRFGKRFGTQRSAAAMCSPVHQLPPIGNHGLGDQSR